MNNEWRFHFQDNIIPDEFDEDDNDEEDDEDDEDEIVENVSVGNISLNFTFPSIFEEEKVEDGMGMRVSIYNEGNPKPLGKMMSIK